MGPVPLMKLAVPILVSGTAAREFHHLAGLQGLTTTVLSSQAGDASSLKMLWSVMTKGTIALLAESLTAAHRLGLLEPLLGLIGQEYGNTGTPAMVMRMLRSTAASGDRRLVEMQEARRTLDGAAVPSWAVEATMRWIAALNGMPGVADGQTVPEVVRAASDALGALADTTTTPSS
jgi:3-hydroxyisobutyrate dehydrogenase-like beta-hydroxyacid dehydrogenase